MKEMGVASMGILCEKMGVVSIGILGEKIGVVSMGILGKRTGGCFNRNAGCDKSLWLPIANSLSTDCPLLHVRSFLHQIFKIILDYSRYIPILREIIS